MELAVLNRSRDPIVAASLAWAIRAVNRQLVEHVLPVYENFFRRIRLTPEHWPVVAYNTVKGLDPNDYDPLYVLDDVPAGELGSHQNVGGVVTARALALGEHTAITISHEAIEWRADRPASIWIRQGDGSALAFEPADAVEATDYPMDVEFMRVTRRVRLSNFVLPSWFIPGSEGPWDYLGLLDGPGKLLERCHAVRMELDGSITTHHGRGSAPGLHHEKETNPMARTHRRIAAERPPILFDPAMLAG